MMEPLLKAAAEKALACGRKAGADVEAYAMHQRELQVEVAGGEADTLKEAADMGLGIRILQEGRLGFAYTSDLSDQAIKEAVADAAEIATHMQPDDHYRLTPSGLCYSRQHIFDQTMASHTIAEKIDLASQAEQAARDGDHRIVMIERAGYQEHAFNVLIMNSAGLYAFDRGNHCGLYVFAVAKEDDDTQSGFASMSRRLYRDLNPEQIGHEAAWRAARGLRAKTMASGCYPCVLEPSVAVRFLGLLARMIDAEAVQKGRSPFADSLGKPVAASGFTIIDDATTEGGIATFPFDDEGIPAQQQVVIQDGVLTSFLHDNYTASKAGVASTGNARRMSYRSLPSISPNNFTIQTGPWDDRQMIDDVRRGFYVTDVLGMHTANPVSGEFSLGAAGLLIENGVITDPVRGVVIAGNILDLLQRIDAVGNDLRYYGSRGSPTIRVAQMSIAGT